MRFLNPIIGISIGFLLLGCASTRKEFKAADVKSQEGTVTGKVNIIYNKKLANPDCSICFNSVNGPCQKLLPDGIILIGLPQGENNLRRVACKDISVQHFNFDNTSFQVRPGINYFGEVTIDWTNKGGYKASDAFGALGVLIGETKNDGQIKISATDSDTSSILKEYEDITKQKPSILQKSILKITE